MFFVFAQVWRDDRSVAKAIVRAQPDSAKGHSNLGALLYKSGVSSVPPKLALIDRGREQLERALELYYIDPYVSLFHVYTTQNRYEDAERMAEQLSLRAPDELRSVSLLAKARSQVGKHRESLALWETALKANPDHDTLPKLRDQVIRDLLTAHDYAAVIEACDKVLARDPESVEHLLMRFQGMGLSGQHQNAWTAFWTPVHQQQTTSPHALRSSTICEACS
jgi:tetratricopeptide (TPR) repeat protein